MADIYFGEFSLILPQRTSVWKGKANKETRNRGHCIVELTMVLKESKKYTEKCSKITRLRICKRRGHHYHHRWTLTYISGWGGANVLSASKAVVLRRRSSVVWLFCVLQICLVMNVSSIFPMYSAGAFGDVYAFAILYHVNEIFGCACDRLLN